MGYIAKEKEINLLHTESERMYRRLVEELRIGVYMADAEGKLFYVNSAFVQILGYQNREEVLGLNLPKQLYLNPEDRKMMLKNMEKTGFVRDYVVRNKRKDGSVVVLSVTSNYIRNTKEDVIGVEGVVEDITERIKLEEKSEILTNAVEQTADHVMITNKEGTIEYVNPAFEKTTGFSKKDALGKNPKILQSGQQTREYYQELWATILAGKVFHAHTTNKKKNGEFYVADQTISPIINEVGEITHFVSIWNDVTEKVKLEEYLKIEKQKLEEIIGFDEKISAIRKSERLMDFVVFKIGKILEAEKCSIWLIDEETKELCVKASTGFDEHKQRCIKLNESIAMEVVQEGQPLLIQDAESQHRFQHFKDASFWGRSFMIAPIKLDENVIGVICVADKFTHPNQDTVFNEVDLKILSMIAREVAVAIENVRFYKELQFLTITDPMTNIHNFRHFIKTLDYEVKRLKRFPGNLGLMMMDIDSFKSYNDQFGHLAGDQLLREIGQIIHKNLREVDVLCRYAGDEFVIIMPGTDGAGSEIAAERVREAIHEAQFKKPVTVSIGVAQYKQGMTRHELTSKADRALYQAKHEGKNKVCVFG